jgi:predicted 2-oxoglutarate/Fe(II)-dependent dioxygenase YbiX
MLETTSLPMQVGDRPPLCYGMSSDRLFYSFEEQYGRPAVLILAGAKSRQLAAVAAGLVPHLSSFLARNADVLILAAENPDRLFGGMLALPPIRTIDCGGFLLRCGVGPSDLLVLVLDRNLRIAMRLEAEKDTDTALACLACLDALPFEAPRDIAMPAPVILLPNLLQHALCRHLIDLFETSPTIDGAVARVDAAGHACSVVDHQKKHRRDMMIQEDTELHRMLRDILLARCVPEIAKAFQSNTAYTDRILISRYDHAAGWFRRHRDNAACNVAFREFALSVNLNTGEYEGGHLSFPEYNDHRYCPSAGGGVIFSTALLHEAAPVTAGRRYVLLTFLHGEAAEARRLARVAQAQHSGVLALAGDSSRRLSCNPGRTPRVSGGLSGEDAGACTGSENPIRSLNGSRSGM